MPTKLSIVPYSHIVPIIYHEREKTIPIKCGVRKMVHYGDPYRYRDLQKLSIDLMSIIIGC